jgi:hypothetical protein
MGECDRRAKQSRPRGEDADSGVHAPDPPPAFGTLDPDYKVPRGWRPYRADATWNQKLGPHPTLDPDDAAKIAWSFHPVFNDGQPVDQLKSVDPYDGAGLPVWFARTTDPLVTIRCHAGYGAGGSNGCPLPSHVYVPAKATAQNDVDYHMVIVQPDGREVDVWEWGAGNFAYEKNPAGLQTPPWQRPRASTSGGAGRRTSSAGQGGTAARRTAPSWRAATFSPAISSRPKSKPDTSTMRSR